MSNRNKNTKEALLLRKEELLRELKYYDERITDARNNKTNSGFYDDDSSDSEEFPKLAANSGPSLTELMMQQNMLSTCLEATEELTNLEIVQSQIERMVDEPVFKSEPPVSEPGTWREVIAECRADLVLFTISFNVHTADRLFGPLSYRNLQVKAIKSAHDKELSKSVLSSLRTPSEAVGVVQAYARAHRSRRYSLARLADRYADKLIMEPREEGGYSLRCLGLRLVWELHNKWSPLAPFSHRLSFVLDYLDESYVKIVSSAHRQLSEPYVDTDERTRLLVRIIDTCLKAKSDIDKNNTSPDKKDSQIGDKSKDSQIGDKTKDSQIGDKTKNSQIGDKTKDSQIGDKTKDSQIGDKTRDSELMAPPTSVPKIMKAKLKRASKGTSYNKKLKRLRSEVNGGDDESENIAKVTDSTVKSNLQEQANRDEKSLRDKNNLKSDSNHRKINKVNDTHKKFQNINNKGATQKKKAVDNIFSADKKDSQIGDKTKDSQIGDKTKDSQIGDKTRDSELMAPPTSVPKIMKAKLKRASKGTSYNKKLKRLRSEVNGGDDESENIAKVTDSTVKSNLQEQANRDEKSLRDKNNLKSDSNHRKINKVNDTHKKFQNINNKGATQKKKAVDNIFSADKKDSQIGDKTKDSQIGDKTKDSQIGDKTKDSQIGDKTRDSELMAPPSFVPKKMKAKLKRASKDTSYNKKLKRQRSEVNGGDDESENIAKVTDSTVKSNLQEKANRDEKSLRDKNNLKSDSKHKKINKVNDTHKKFQNINNKGDTQKKKAVDNIFSTKKVSGKDLQSKVCDKEKNVVSKRDIQNDREIKKISKSSDNVGKSNDAQKNIAITKSIENMMHKSNKNINKQTKYINDKEKTCKENKSNELNVNNEKSKHLLERFPAKGKGDFKKPVDTLKIECNMKDQKNNVNNKKILSQVGKKSDIKSKTSQKRLPTDNLKKNLLRISPRKLHSTLSSTQTSSNSIKIPETNVPSLLKKPPTKPKE